MRTVTVKGLLDAAEKGDVHHYIAERRPAGEEEWTHAEQSLQDLHDRGLVLWEDSLIGVRLTDEGRAHLAKLRTR